VSDLTSSAAPEPLPDGPIVAGHAGLGRLWLRMALFSVPVVLIAGLVEFALWRSGDTWPIAAVAARQQHTPAVFLRELMPQDLHGYKLARLALQRPRVLVLGSSRSSQMRAAMLGETRQTFFNGSGMVDAVSDLDGLCAGGAQPAVALLAVDLWWFNDSLPPVDRKAAGDGAVNWRAHVAAGRKLLMRPALLGDMLAAPSADDSDRIGIGARRTGSGFRQDGSMRLTFVTPSDPARWTYEDREIPPVIARVRAASHQFVESERHRVSGERLAHLQAFLDRCRAQGIALAAFAPPFSTEVFDTLRRDVRHRGLLSSFRVEVAGVFERSGVPFIDATDLTALGLDDRYMFDGFHPTETFHLHVLRRLLDRHPATAALVPGARRAIATLLSAPATNFWYVGLPPGE